jgi:hypothetical protein
MPWHSTGTASNGICCARGSTFMTCGGDDAQQHLLRRQEPFGLAHRAWICRYLQALKFDRR